MHILHPMNLFYAVNFWEIFLPSGQAYKTMSRGTGIVTNYARNYTKCLTYAFHVFYHLSHVPRPTMNFEK